MWGGGSLTLVLSCPVVYPNIRRFFYSDSVRLGGPPYKNRECKRTRCGGDVAGYSSLSPLFALCLFSKHLSRVGKDEEMRCKVQDTDSVCALRFVPPFFSLQMRLTQECSGLAKHDGREGE